MPKLAAKTYLINELLLEILLINSEKKSVYFKAENKGSQLFLKWSNFNLMTIEDSEKIVDKEDNIDYPIELSKTILVKAENVIWQTSYKIVKNSLAYYNAKDEIVELLSKLNWNEKSVVFEYFESRLRINLFSVLVTSFSYWTPSWNSFCYYLHLPVIDYKWAILRDGTGPSNR